MNDSPSGTSLTEEDRIVDAAALVAVMLGTTVSVVFLDPSPFGLVRTATVYGGPKNWA